jgi:hypothetical protein
MDVGDNGSAQAIAEELSSPPSSLSDLSPQRSDLHFSNHNSSRDALGFGVSQHPSKNSDYAQPQPPATSATAAQSGVNDKPKRNSRAPVVLPDGTIRERKKPGPKPKPKDPNAPDKPKRKRQKVLDGPTSAPTQASPQPDNSYQQTAPPTQQSAPRQSKITDLVNHMPPSQPRAASEVYNPSPVPPAPPAPPAPPVPSAPPAPPHQVAHLSTTPSTPRPASSGQVFDPIRGEVSNRVSNDSQSPTITTHHPNSSRFVPSTSVTSAPVSPIPPMAKPPQNTYHVPQHSSSFPPHPSATASASTSTPVADAMDIDGPTKPTKAETGSAGPSSNAPTPPPQKRAKEQPPPLPTGSGLLAGTPFGGLGGAPTTNGSTGTNIWLTFPLKGQNNVTINFAREVEKRYGFAALHPRLAARKERQRQLAAASNALEKAAGLGSADEMSLDLSEPESGNEGDANGDASSNAQAGDGTKKRRKRKAEDYDRGDEFIDDTELAWEESALMAKDGFFVYSGPLMAENEKPTIDQYVVYPMLSY